MMDFSDLKNIEEALAKEYHPIDQSDDGEVGEVWCEVLSESQFSVKCTGSSVVGFSYIAAGASIVEAN